MSAFLERVRNYSSKRLALLAANLQERVDELERREPIAIVGIGCRFPGACDTPEAYWSLLEARREAIAEVPADRWDVDRYFDPDPDVPGKMNTRWGAWLEGVDRFDSAFFGISPREARSLDPQQRLFLEVTWRALEDAGIPASDIQRQPVGVFCGISGTDYHGLVRGAGLEGYDAYLASGVAHSMASGRTSYVLGATGPSISVDTACSSSLVAIHHAVQSLRTGECDVALAGGTNLILTPDTSVALSRAHMMAPDGRCKAFDARADGFVRGEGAGVVVLKRLSSAEAAGDRIVALIRGSAVNQDGRSNGLTAPNGTSQEAVLMAALDDAGIDPSEIDFVEAHGTGTALGDPIEVHALGATLGAARRPDAPLKIGSVKAAIGHLEAAAGVAGLVKAALALKEARLPGQINLGTLNPFIEWDRHPVAPQRTTEPWPASADRPRRAGVSSFGFSGTNAHVVLEEAPAPARKGREDRSDHILTVSGKTEAAVARLLEARKAELDRGVPLADLAATMNAGRDHFRHRAAAVARDAAEARTALGSDGALVRGFAPERPPKLCFVFGDAPDAPMAFDIATAHPDLRAALDHVDDLLAPALGGRIADALDGRADPAAARLAHMGMQLALSRTWRGWNVVPTLVLGSGMGEFAAAVTAGVLSEAEAVSLAAGTTTTGDLSFATPQIDVFSAATGGEASGAIAEAAHWRDGAPGAARHREAREAVAAAGADVLLAMGSGPADGPGSGGDAEPLRLSSLRPGDGGARAMIESLGQLYVRGVDIDWGAFETRPRAPRIVAAGYPFERERHWIDVPADTGRPEANAATPAHFPGRAVALPNSDDRVLEMSVGLESHPWIADHKVFGARLLPSPLYLEWALRAAEERFGDGPVALDDFELHRPVDVGRGARAIRLARAPAVDGSAALTISCATSDGGWLDVAAGRAVAGTGRAEVPDDETPTVLRRLERPVASDALYAEMEQLGLSFGPRFRALSEIRAGRGRALARVVPPAGLTDADAYLLHPAVLDSCFHLIAAALPEGVLQQPFLMLGIEHISVWARPTGAFWCSVRTGPEAADLKGRETFGAEATLFDENDVPLATFRGMRLKRASEASLRSSDGSGSVQRLIHEVEWRRLPEPSPPATALRSAAAAFEARAAEAGLLDRYPAFKRALDGLCSAYVVRALRDLGCGLAAGNRLDARSLMRDLRIDARHERLTERMLEMLREDGILAGGPTYEVRTAPDEVDVGRASSELAARYPDGTPEIEVVHQCAVRLAEVLRGTVDPLTLMFPDGSIDMMERLYGSTRPAEVYNATLGDVAARIAEGIVPDRTIRILEIGAGTGSATKAILAALEGRSVAYHFTDVSPLFLNRGKAQLSDRSDVTFATLDIGADLAGQGFAGQQFDLVIGANVLHATSDMRATLGRVAELIASDGTLLLLEGTAKQRFGDLTVGLLPGWWAFEDGDLRSYALMPRADWVALLARHGFEDVAALPGGAAAGTLAEQAIFAARPAAHGPTGERWLLLGDGAVPSALAEEARAAGVEVDRIEAASGRAGPALGTALDTGRHDKVVLLDKPEALRGADAAPGALVDAQVAALAHAVDVVQALARREEAVPRLCFVTRGAQRVGPQDRPDPAQASLWGFADTVALEHPELECLRIDVDPAAEPDARHLVAALSDRGPEDQIALRGGDRYVRRLVRSARRLPSTPPAFDAGRTVLIAGAFGGLGLATAEWAVEHGARHLALLGRSEPGTEARAAIDRMRARGAELRTIRCDIADDAALGRALEAVREALPPVAVAIHSAGALSDGALLSMDETRIAAVLGPKVGGAWGLARRLPELEMLVLYSSGASLGGSAGQANHAAANAFEDALAHSLDADGRRAVAINWGLWGEIGAGARQDGRGSAILRPIPPADGLAALGMVMEEVRANGCAQIAVIDADWSRAGASPFYAGLSAAAPAEAPDVQSEEAGSGLRAAVASAPATRRAALVQAEIQGHLRKVLGLRDDAKVDVRESFQDMGVDSLMAVELRNRVGQSAALTLPATITFDHPTVADLAAHVLRLIDGAEAQAPVAPRSPDIQEPEPDDTEGTPDIEAMPDQEFARLLAERLDRIDKDLPE